MNISAPLPPNGQFIASVRSSCAATRRRADIAISTDAVDAFLRGLEQAKFERLSAAHGVSFPLKFDSVADEANFLAVLSMLNFLSAYRIPLHNATGSGAYQNVLRLLMGLYISGPNSLSARALAALQPDGVASLLGVSMHAEAPSGIPGVVMGTPRSGDMFEVCTLVCKACNEAGTRLERMGLRDLGELVLRTIKENKSKSDEEKCEAIVAQLVANIPAFADAYLIDGTQPVYLYKKAFFLLEAFARRLSAAGAPSTACLPMFVDNVLPTVLVHARVLDLSSASPALRKWGADPDAKGEEKNQPGPQLRKEDAYAVRAAALDAGTQIVKRAKELAEEEGRGWMASMTEADLDGYLWAVAKDDPALRLVPRMAERDTVMY